jgi:hypothetical protein
MYVFSTNPCTFSNGLTCSRPCYSYILSSLNLFLAISLLKPTNERFKQKVSQSRLFLQKYLELGAGQNNLI